MLLLWLLESPIKRVQDVLLMRWVSQELAIKMQFTFALEIKQFLWMEIVLSLVRIMCELDMESIGAA